jgi:hypothetical protein
MANLNEIKDQRLKRELQQAFQQMRSGKPSDAVRTIAGAFIYLLELKPEIRDATAAIRGGRRVPILTRWPALGANWKQGSLESGTPEIEYVRDRFALSEAITYFEFTVETAIDHDA